MMIGMVAALVTIAVLILTAGVIFWFLNTSGVYQILQTSRERQHRANRS